MSGHTTAPAGAKKKLADLQIEFGESQQSAQDRTLRAVSGNWNCGMPVSFRLQADRLEGQVNSCGIGLDARSRGPQWAR